MKIEIPNLVNKLLILNILGIVAACVTTTKFGDRIDQMPMYGQPTIIRSDDLKKMDAEFIAKASAGFNGDRNMASKVWWREGEKFMLEDNIDFAMRRYNQSWLLNPNNYQAFWGFARVKLSEKKIEEAQIYFQRALDLCDDNFQKPALLSDFALSYSFAKQYAVAEKYFLKSLAIDEVFATTWLRWSQSLYREGKYAEAWKKIFKLRELGARVPESYLLQLNSAMAEPRKP